MNRAPVVDESSIYIIHTHLTAHMYEEALSRGYLSLAQLFLVLNRHARARRREGEERSEGTCIFIRLFW